jgi:hypothetical protein
LPRKVTAHHGFLDGGITPIADSAWLISVSIK